MATGVCTVRFALALLLFSATTTRISVGSREHRTAVWYEFDQTGRKSELKFSYTVPERASEEDKLTFAPTHDRAKRKVYGEDDRISINPRKYYNKFPFSSVVFVSTGCSGIFVAPNRVLTAAHCIWNYGSYKPGVASLSVQFPRRNGRMREELVTRYFVPGAWFDRSRDGWEEYDYALLQILSDYGNNTRRGSMELGLGVDKGPLQQNGVGKLVEMVGYPDDKPRNTSWYVHCNVLATTPTRLYFECDAARGMSGSVVYTKEFDCNTTTYVRRAIGVFSGTKYSDEDDREYNVAIRFNPEHYLQMCHIMGTRKECEDRYYHYFYSSSRKLQREQCLAEERKHYCETYG